MKIEKFGEITIVSSAGLLPAVERLCGNVLLVLSPADRAELTRISREGLAPLMELGFNQPMAQRVRKALGIRTYTGESPTTRWRRAMLDALYAEAERAGAQQFPQGPPPHEKGSGEGEL